MNIEIVNILDLIAQLEMSVSEMYSECARKYPLNESFWKGLADAEVHHVNVIKTISGLYTQGPADFQVARPFTPAGVNAALAWVRDNTARLKSGYVPEEKMYFIARDIEASLLESKFMDFLKSQIPEFNDLVRTITEETENHKKALIQRISFR